MLEFFRKRMRDDRGFTLIELMVVVLIIAILIAIAIPTFLGLRSRAQDRAAQADLRNGLTAAKAYFTDDETFVGFDAEAANIEPSIEWNTAAVGATVDGEVSIRNMGASTVVLVTQSESGTFFCIGDDGGANVTGEGDVATVADCTASAAAW